MTMQQVVLAVAGILAIVSSLVAMVVTKPRPTGPLEALYLTVPVLGVIVLVTFIANS